MRLVYGITDYDKENGIIIYKHGDEYGKTSTHEIISELRKYVSNRLNINFIIEEEDILRIECEYENVHYTTAFYLSEYCNSKTDYLQWLAREIAVTMGMELFFKKED